LGSVAFGLGQLGGSVGLAKELQRKDQIEKIKLAIEQGNLGVQQQYAATNDKRLGLEAARDAEMKKYRDAQIAQIAAKMNQSPPMVKKVQDAEAALGRKLTDAEKMAVVGIKLPTSPHTPETQEQKLAADLEMYLKHPDFWKTLHPPRKAGGSTGGSELPERTVKALADKWTNDGVKPPSKYQAAVEEYMEDNKMSPKIKLTVGEQRLKDIVKQIEPKVDQLQKLIEDNKLTDSGGIGSALGQRYEFGKYKMGIKPDKVHSDLIKAAAALQVMGAAPWMQIGRGKYMFETITQHLPSPNDSPALLYDKAQFLKGIVAEAKQSMPDAAGGGGEAGATIPGEVIEK
jgi:hypothetical protein